MNTSLHDIVHGLTSKGLSQALPSEANVWGSVWYPLLCCIATVNLVLLVVAIVLPESLPPAPRNNRHLQLILATPHIVGVALLTYLPTQCMKRLVWLDEPISNVFILRLVSSIAQVSWFTQLALALVYVEQSLLVASGMSSFFTCGRVIGQFMLIIVCMGEFIHATGEVMKDDLFLVAGEGLRAFGLLSLVPVAVKLLATSYAGDKAAPTAESSQGRCSAKFFLWALVLYCIAYFAWALLWIMEVHSLHYDGQPWLTTQSPLSFVDGLKDALTTRIPAVEWDAWKPIVVWMALHYNVSSWASLLLVWPGARADKVGAGDVDASRQDIESPFLAKDVDGGSSAPLLPSDAASDTECEKRALLAGKPAVGADAEDAQLSIWDAESALQRVETEEEKELAEQVEAAGEDNAQNCAKEDSDTTPQLLLVMEEAGAPTPMAEVVERAPSSASGMNSQQEAEPVEPLAAAVEAAGAEQGPVETTEEAEASQSQAGVEAVAEPPAESAEAAAEPAAEEASPGGSFPAVMAQQPAEPEQPMPATSEHDGASQSLAEAGEAQISVETTPPEEVMPPSTATEEVVAPDPTATMPAASTGATSPQRIPGLPVRDPLSSSANEY